MAGLDDIIKSTQWAQKINKFLGLSSQISEMQKTQERINIDFGGLNTITQLSKSFQQQEKSIKNISEKGMLTELTKSFQQQERYTKNWGRTGSLADLYNPLTMPPALVKSDNELDKAVDAAYSKQAFTNEAKRMEFLFELYEKYIAGCLCMRRKGRNDKMP